MLAVSSQMLHNFSWPLDDLLKHQENNMMFVGTEAEGSGSGLSSPTSSQAPRVGNSEMITRNLEDSGCNGWSKKKLNHNASERDRRRRINDLYSSLRSLLPAADHKKKLSIPATISRVLKYIPELQREVETLVEKKEALNMKKAKAEEGYNNAPSANPRTCKEDQTSLAVVSATLLGETEVLMQISIPKSIKGSIVETLQCLDHEEGLELLSMSSFQSFGGRIFYNLHLQGHHKTQVTDLEGLRGKLLSLYNYAEFQS